MVLLLGSQSPRRREILSFFSLPFRQVSPDFDEDAVPFHGDPAAYACTLALGKADSLAETFPNEIILTADTVVHRNGRLFQKPANLDEAFAMLRELAGHEHQVYTGVCVRSGSKVFQEAELARVFFTEMTDSQIHQYINSIHPFDKAGGYAIQNSGSLIVKRIEGCYYNVMGLPLQTVRRLLLKLGIDLWEYCKSV